MKLIFFCLFAIAFSLTTVGMSLPGKGLHSGQEFTLFEHTNKDGNRGMITFFWFTATFKNIKDTLLRFNIDNKETLELPAYLALGIGPDEDVMFGSDFVGKGAKTGGAYGTYRIPWEKTIKVTVVPPSDGVFWFILRGLEGNDQDSPKMLNVKIGDVELPSTAKLHVSKLSNKTLAKLERVSLVNTLDTKTPTALLMTNLHVISQDAKYVLCLLTKISFLEGCFRAFTPELPTDQPQLLSSGTEDYFQSAFYFDGGLFQYPEAGITHWDNKEAMMYKFHERDVVIFNDGVNYVWRNGEDQDPKTKMKCGENPNGIEYVKLSPSVVNTLVWYYTW